MSTPSVPHPYYHRTTLSYPFRVHKYIHYYIHHSQVMSPASYMSSANIPLTLATTATAVQIPVYDGKNFLIWEARVRAYLAAMNGLSAIDDDVTGDQMYAKALQADNVTEADSEMYIDNQETDVAWYLDSGATSHVCNDSKLFKSFNFTPDNRILGKPSGLV
ncbi:hypothetical protein V1527DRAFT_492701 [Lipomyces starkeyi]